MFDWPTAPRRDGGVADLRLYSDHGPSSAYTAHLMDVSRADAFFVAFTPEFRLAFGYVWRQADFPWMGIWEENRSRLLSPWNGQAVTRGMEFGVSPFPETRQHMIDRGRMFEVPTYRWIPAHTSIAIGTGLWRVRNRRLPTSLRGPTSELRTGSAMGWAR